MARVYLWVVPVLFGLVVYLAVDNYGPSEHGYNRQVAGYVFAAAAMLLLLAACTGRRIRVPLSLQVTGALFVAAAALSIWQAPSLYWSSNRAHLYIAVIVLGVSLYLMHGGPGATAVVERYFLVVPVVHAFVLISVMFWLISIQGVSNPDWTRPPNFGNVRHFGYLGFLAGACAASLFLLSRKLPLIAFGLTVAALFGIVLLGTRGALVAWVIFAAFVGIFHGARVRFLLFCLAASACAGIVVHHLTDTGILVAPSLFARFDADEGSAFQVSDRIGIWRDSVRAITSRPWLGFGPEGYIHSRCCEPHLVQPHNFVLQFLLEFGLLGTALASGAIYLLVREFGGIATIARNLNSHLALLVVSGVIVGFLAYAMVDGLLYHAIPLLHFALLVSLLFALLKEHRGPARTPGFESEAPALAPVRGEMRLDQGGASHPHVTDRPFTDC